MPRIEKLSDYIKPVKSVASAIPSSAAVTVVAVDASGGFDRVCHILQLGAFGATGTFDAEVTESATSGGTYTLIASSGISALVSTGAGKTVIIDVPVNNSKPFQKIRATAGVSTVAVGGVALMYNGSRVLPTADAATVAENVFVA